MLEDTASDACVLYSLKLWLPHVFNTSKTPLIETNSYKWEKYDYKLLKEFQHILFPQNCNWTLASLDSLFCFMKTVWRENLLQQQKFLSMHNWNNNFKSISHVATIESHRQIPFLGPWRFTKLLNLLKTHIWFCFFDISSTKL